MVNSTVNYAHPNNVSSAEGFFINYLNTQTNGTWSLVLVGLSFGIPFLSLQVFGIRKAFAMASFNALISTVLLAGFGVITGTVYTLVAVGTALALVLNNNGGVR